MDKKKKKKLKLKKSIRDFIFSKNFLILIVIIIVLLFSVMLGISFAKKVSLVNKAPDDEKNNYVAYVNVGTLIEIDFSEICNKADSGAIIDCNEPIVSKYKPLTDSAKNVFNGTNLLNPDRDLMSVITLAGTTAKSKGVVFDKVYVYSNWSGIKKYIDDANTNDISYEVNVLKNNDLKSSLNNLILESTYHTVTFDSDGGSFIDSQSVKHGSTAVRPTNPVKTGYTFAGWQLDGTSFDFSTPIDADITLKAVYNQINVRRNRTYTVTNNQVTNAPAADDTNNTSTTSSNAENSEQ